MERFRHGRVSTTTNTHTEREREREGERERKKRPLAAAGTRKDARKQGAKRATERARATTGGFRLDARKSLKGMKNDVVSTTTAQHVITVLFAWCMDRRFGKNNFTPGNERPRRRRRRRTGSNRNQPCATCWVGANRPDASSAPPAGVNKCSVANRTTYGGGGGTEGALSRNSIRLPTILRFVAAVYPLTFPIFSFVAWFWSHLGQGPVLD